MKYKLYNITPEQLTEFTEIILSKNKNPQNFYSSLFSIFRKLHRIQKTFQNENLDTQLIDQIINHFNNQNLKNNKRQFRRTFRNFERKPEATVFFNQEIIVEQKYVNPRMQAFFEYVFNSPEIMTDNFDIEILFTRFMSNYLNDFSLLVDSVSQRIAATKPTIKKQGRPGSKVDEKGDLKGLSKETKKAIKLYNQGKTGKEIYDDLFPKENYKKKFSKRTKAKNNLKAKLRYHWKHNSHLFTRPFEIKLFINII